MYYAFVFCLVHDQSIHGIRVFKNEEDCLKIFKRFVNWGWVWQLELEDFKQYLEIELFSNQLSLGDFKLEGSYNCEEKLCNIKCNRLMYGEVLPEIKGFDKVKIINPDMILVFPSKYMHDTVYNYEKDDDLDSCYTLNAFYLLKKHNLSNH